MSSSALSIPFVISYRSSEGHIPSSRTNVRHVEGTGWISAPGCVYPQTVIIKLSTPYELERVQLIVHPHFVPTKVSVSLGDNDKQDTNWRDMGTSLFRYNADRTMASSERPSERKTMLFTGDTSAKCIRLSFARPHHDSRDNSAGQVGILSIAVYGKRLSRAKMLEREGNSSDEEAALGIIARERQRQNGQLKDSIYDSDGELDIYESDDTTVVIKEKHRPLKKTKTVTKPPSSRRTSLRPTTSQSPRRKMKLAPDFEYDLHIFGDLIRLLKKKMNIATEEERYLDAKEIKQMRESLIADENRCETLVFQRHDAIEKQDFARAHEAKSVYMSTRNDATLNLPRLARHLNDEEQDRYIIHWATSRSKSRSRSRGPSSAGTRVTSGRRPTAERDLPNGDYYAVEPTNRVEKKATSDKSSKKEASDAKTETDFVSLDRRSKKHDQIPHNGPVQQDRRAPPTPPYERRARDIETADEYLNRRSINRRTPDAIANELYRQNKIDALDSAHGLGALYPETATVQRLQRMDKERDPETARTLQYIANAAEKKNKMHSLHPGIQRLFDKYGTTDVVE